MQWFCQAITTLLSCANSVGICILRNAALQAAEHQMFILTGQCTCTFWH